MTDFSAAPAGIEHRPGRHNLASAAFEELRAARREGRAPEGGGVTFGDLIDTINPLQHIPLVSEAYRGMTGDRISPQARVAGGALWGGPIGLVASVASLAIGGNGEDGVGDRIYASLFGGDTETGTKVAAVSAEPPAPAQAPKEDKLATASIAEEAVAAPPAEPAPARLTPGETKPLPRLSPEAFQALIGSFADPSPQAPAEHKPDADRPSDLASTMLDALDKYEAMKAGNPAE